MQLETYETKVTAYAARIVNLTDEVAIMEKDPDAFNEAYVENIKVQIKQVEALVIELQSSVQGSAVVFKSLRETVRYVCFGIPEMFYLIVKRLSYYNERNFFQVTTMISTLTRLEVKYDKSRVLETRREYIKIQLELEECERRHQEMFNPNIGEKLAHNFHTLYTLYSITYI